MKEKWVQVSDEAPGYFGSRRDATFAQWDQQYGQGNWRLGWIAGEATLDFVGACQLYEDAYVEYFRARPELLDYITELACDVYDDNESNVHSGFDYQIQETSNTHIQDIAIRCSLRRLGRTFQGQNLVQIRDAEGKTAISKALSPGQVPFHLPALITNPTNIGKQWWLPYSVEDYYQRNKRLLVIT